MRLPLVFGPALDARDGDVILTEIADCPTSATSFTLSDHAERGAHPPACTCCAARNPAGRALASLLQDRARGRLPFFKRVVASTHTAAGHAAVLDALATDPVASACFRLDSWEV